MFRMKSHNSRDLVAGAVPFAMLCLLLFGGCAGSIGTTARSMLNHVRDDPDPNKRFQAYSKLGKLGVYDGELEIAESVAELTKRLESGKEPSVSRAMICRTLGRLKQPECRAPLVKAMEDPDDEVRCEAARALGHVGSNDDAVLLTRMMAIDPTHNGRIAAAEGLATLKPKDPRVLISLTENLNNDDPALRLASYRTLKAITGADPGADANTWHTYLAQTIPGYVEDPVVNRATATTLAGKSTDDTSVQQSQFLGGSSSTRPAQPILPPVAGGLPNP